MWGKMGKNGKKQGKNFPGFREKCSDIAKNQGNNFPGFREIFLYSKKPGT